ncbi:MAG: hypothetical protein J0H49_23860 [Acidobacteria bacterium]|nr:hypothetical protein [Acidobacteriota bacterium]
MRLRNRFATVFTAVAAVLLSGCTAPNPLIATHLNETAAFGGGVKLNPLQGKVITSWVDRRTAAMSTLTGNETAVRYARAGGGPAYPAGSTLSLATWGQVEDGRWFGARIPGAPRSVEIVTVSQDANGQRLYSYQKYEGAPLKRVVSREAGPADERLQFLISQRASVLP